MSAAISPLQAAEGGGLPVEMTMLVEYAAYKANPRSHAASGPAPFLRQGKEEGWAMQLPENGAEDRPEGRPTTGPRIIGASDGSGTDKS